MGRRLVDRGDGRGDEEDDYEGKESKDRGVVSLLFGGCFRYREWRKGTVGVNRVYGSQSITGNFSACQRMSLSEHGLGIYMASPSEVCRFLSSSLERTTKTSQFSEHERGFEM